MLAVGGAKAIKLICALTALALWANKSFGFTGLIMNGQAGPLYIELAS